MRQSVAPQHGAWIIEAITSAESEHAVEEVAPPSLSLAVANTREIHHRRFVFSAPGETAFKGHLREEDQIIQIMINK